MNPTQSARAVLMVQPTSFGFDEETAHSNTFQHKLELDRSTILARANDEFNTAVNILLKHDIDVVVCNETYQSPRPNAVFPNNWLSTWPDGRVFLYPMATASRRVERSENVLETLKKRYMISTTTDLSATEDKDLYLESTGVMIFHHPSKTVYGCVSVRCNEELFKVHAEKLGYTPIVFHAVDEASVPVYHTNVMMGIQSSTAVICLEAIHDEQERGMVRGSLEQRGLDVVEISYTQMNAFCGNVLQIESRHGKKFLAMSQTAFDNFSDEQRARLQKDKTLLPLAIPIIEIIGGGSVRCMLAEIFLPKIN